MAHLLGALGAQGAAEALEESLQGTASRHQISSPPPKRKLVIVANRLPLRMRLKSTGDAPGGESRWHFEWDEDSLLVQSRPGAALAREVLYIGSLPTEVPPEERVGVTKDLANAFSCIPVFMGEELQRKFYKEFCKNVLWPMMHYVLPLQQHAAGRFERNLWNAYLAGNKLFADKVCEVLQPRHDCVWIHDYHLMVLPSYIRHRFHNVRCGFFMHSPFPSSEIFRSFPERESILKGLLNVDLIGFHTFDYARHFLSCCTRVLGLKYESSRGTLNIDYYGRTVGVKICPTGIQPQRLQNCFSRSETLHRRTEFRKMFQGRTVLLGVDDIDMFKGIELKIQAFQMLLETHPEWRGKVCLVQIANPAKAGTKESNGLTDEVRRLTKLINDEYGSPDYEPIVLLERSVGLNERVALYNLARAVVLTATRDGMNLVPYEYIACREGPPNPVVSDPMIQDSLNPRSSALVVSEFVGCSPSLSGAIRVNPWNLSDVADSLYEAISMMEADLKVRHDKHWRYVREHTAQYWAKANLSELERITNKLNDELKCYGVGQGLDFRVVALSGGFSRLQVNEAVRDLHASTTRVIVLDYDGTLAPDGALPIDPTDEALSVLHTLSSDPANSVHMVSGRSREALSAWLHKAPNVTMWAEHGIFVRPAKAMEWQVVESTATSTAHTWKAHVLPLMEEFTEVTDGAFVEVKEASLAWHHGGADPDFGAFQAGALAEELECKLAGTGAEVVKGSTVVEVKPRGVSKGRALEKALSNLHGTLEFLLVFGTEPESCDLFDAVAEQKRAQIVYACSVGSRPSKACFYLDSVNDVLNTLTYLAPSHSAMQVD